MPPFILRLKKQNGPSHIMIIISKKIDKRATARNRMRRLLRETIRHTVPEGADGAIVVRQNFADWKQTDVEKEFVRTYHEKHRP